MAKAASGGTKGRLGGGAAGGERIQRTRKKRQAEGQVERENAPEPQLSTPPKKTKQNTVKTKEKVKSEAVVKSPKAVRKPSPAVRQARAKKPVAGSPVSAAVPAPVTTALTAPLAETAERTAIAQAGVEPVSAKAAIKAPATDAHVDDLPWGESPADLPLPETGEQPGLGWMAQVLVLTSVLLVLLNSFAVDKWARSLPVNAYSGRIIDAADAWHGAMDRIHFNWPLETGRTGWHWLKAQNWPGAAVTEEDSASSMQPTGSGDPG